MHYIECSTKKPYSLRSECLKTYTDLDGVTITYQYDALALRYPGQYFDSESGLHYNDRRYYDPSFPADTLVHTRIQTDSGYQVVLKPIDQIRVGDEVLAWDEVKAHDLAQAQTQAKQAPSPRNVSTGSSRIDSADVAIPATALAADSATVSLGSAQSYQKVTQVYHTPEQVRTLVHLRLVLPRRPPQVHTQSSTYNSTAKQDQR